VGQDGSVVGTDDGDGPFLPGGKAANGEDVAEVGTTVKTKLYRPRLGVETLEDELLQESGWESADSAVERQDLVRAADLGVVELHGVRSWSKRLKKRRCLRCLPPIRREEAGVTVVQAVLVSAGAASCIGDPEETVLFYDEITL
jgi:hypothetical protein